MKKVTLYEYKDKIMKLPKKERYSKEELLIPDFLLEQDGALEVYYAPHNEYINEKGKVFIIGITPGFQQMSTAIATAREQLELDLPIHEIQCACKVAGRFSGAIRKNIISMLDELHLPKLLEIENSNELFGREDSLLHTVSLIPYSVFIHKKNYSGSSPKIMKNECLRSYVYENFVTEYQKLENPDKMLLIPLGRAVEEVLLELAQENLIHKNQILQHFPHPSGANVNRKAQFEEKKADMIQFLQAFFQKE